LVTAAKTPRALGLSAEACGMLPWCIALSAALHVLLLATMFSAGPRLGGLAKHAAGHAAPPVSVRLVADGTASGRGGLASASIASSASSSATSTTPRLPVGAGRAASAAASAGGSMAAVSAGSRASMPGPRSMAEADPFAADAMPASGGASDGGYVPRPLLSVAPVATAPVVIAPPPATAEVGRRVGVLALYIDEQGRVRRIEAEPPLLPPAMEQAAREAFAAARFSPGEVDAHAVKSRIRVEVTFDAGSLPAASAASAASGASAAGVTSGASAVHAASAASAIRPASDQRSR
jgi:periplasmic protein TonB